MLDLKVALSFNFVKLLLNGSPLGVGEIFIKEVILDRQIEGCVNFFL